MTNAALLLAGGRGSRMGGATEDKTMMFIAGKPVIRYSVDAFIQSEQVHEFVFVYRDEEQQAQIKNIVSDVIQRYKVSWVRGGEERQDSVFNGLLEVSLANNFVFIHDCARPLIRAETIVKLAQEVRRDKAVCLAHPIVDTLKFVTTQNREMRHCELDTVDRSHLWAMETPQVFDLELILEAYRRLRYEGVRVTDDTSAFCYDGGKVSLLNPGYPNYKLTTPQDLLLIEFLLRSNEIK